MNQPMNQPSFEIQPDLFETNATVTCLRCEHKVEGPNNPDTIAAYMQAHQCQTERTYDTPSGPPESARFYGTGAARD